MLFNLGFNFLKIRKEPTLVSIKKQNIPNKPLEKVIWFAASLHLEKCSMENTFLNL